MMKTGKSNKQNLGDASTADVFVKMSSGEDSASDRALLNEWKDRHPERQADYDDLSGLWQELDAYTVDLPSSLIKRYHSDIKTGGNKRRFYPWAAAASVAMFLVVLFMLPPLFDPEPEHYITGRGEQRLINMSDGSIVHLNSMTELEVSFDADHRTIKLLQGEAMFKVAHDPQRKFIVGTRNGDVQAIGTAFNINANSEQVTITVLNGTVMVSPREQGRKNGSEPTFASKGRQVVLGKDTLNTADTKNLEKVMAWTERKLVFSGESLQESLKKINRHSKHRLVVEDSRLKGLPLYGVFNMGDSRVLILALEQSMPVKAVAISDEVTLLIYKE